MYKFQVAVSANRVPGTIQVLLTVGSCNLIFGSEKKVLWIGIVWPDQDPTFYFDANPDPDPTPVLDMLENLTRPLHRYHNFQNFGHNNELF